MKYEMKDKKFNNEVSTSAQTCDLLWFVFDCIL